MRYIYAITVVFFFFFTGCEKALTEPGNDKLVDLAGEWKFQIGDDSSWSKIEFNDSAWDKIIVPSSWENQGFHGYNGYAWYRFSFTGSADLAGKNLALHLGFIDDVDEVWFNGVKIGTSGSFPPDYKTAYNAYRIYYLPASLVNFTSKNTIAVRVYDAQLEGGIMSGDPGIYENETYITPDIDLEGNWKFIQGDSSIYKDDVVTDSAWKDVIVPSYLENQGLSQFEGYGWYRLSFDHKKNDLKSQLLLLLGKIDDFDEVYLNGRLIGGTGNMKDAKVEYIQSEEWMQNRVYTIPAGLIRTDRPNILAVRIFDAFQQGGIYSGPIGIIKKDRYDAFIRKAYNKDE
ncbi:MAG: glycoside hydrolase [Bacteroidetes bacterium]|nr:glycoside hydrolase [Bacteroidota bacterium]